MTTKTVGEQFRKDDYAYVSFSTYLTIKTNEFRNGTPDMGCLETLGRRVSAELLYAALIVASLVETVVRGILTPFGLLAYCFCCCLEESTANKIYAYTFVGSSISLENTLNAASALISNIFCNAIDYDTLLPCFACINADVDILD